MYMYSEILLFLFCHYVCKKEMKNPTNRKTQTISDPKLIGGEVGLYWLFGLYSKSSSYAYIFVVLQYRIVPFFAHSFLT